MPSLIDENGVFLGNCADGEPAPPGQTVLSSEPPEGMDSPRWDSDAGEWIAGEPPEDAALPDLAGFRVAIMLNSSFQFWEEQIPATQRENLKLAAALGNLAELQALYEALALSYPPPPIARDEWQAIADTYHIDIAL